MYILLFASISNIQSPLKCLILLKIVQFINMAMILTHSDRVDSPKDGHTP